jgi:hypothetical protein
MTQAVGPKFKLPAAAKKKKIQTQLSKFCQFFSKGHTAFGILSRPGEVGVENMLENHRSRVYYNKEEMGES